MGNARHTATISPPENAGTIISGHSRLVRNITAVLNLDRLPRPDGSEHRNLGDYGLAIVQIRNHGLVGWAARRLKGHHCGLRCQRVCGDIQGRHEENEATTGSERGIQRQQLHHP